jgi:hypothetical protein
MDAGIHALTRETYHADPCDTPSLSASIATILLAQSPLHAHAAHPRLGGRPSQESETFDLGTAAHDYILEGTEDRYHVITATTKDGEPVSDWRTVAARLERDAARAAGKTPLLQRHLESVRTMAHAARSHVAAFDDGPVPLGDGGVAEQTLVWPEGSIWCRARLDWIHRDFETIDDLKTTTDAEPGAFARALYGRGGDLQAAFYLRGLRVLTGHDAAFRFVVVENAWPFAVSVVQLSPMALAFAAEKVDRAIQIWARCLETGDWPGYPTRTAYVDPPAWATMAEEVRP